MTHDDRIESVAQVLRQAEQEWTAWKTDALAGLREEPPTYHEFLARAADRATLEGIREPSEEMRYAALRELDDSTIAEPGAAAWDWNRAHKAVIDKLLEDG